MPPQSLYLSRLLGSKVLDDAGKPVGWVADAIAHPGGLLPSVSALVVRRSGTHSLRVPWTCVHDVTDGHVSLSTSADRVTERALEEGDILLGVEVLDKQLVDTHGRRVVKVNDLKLVCVRDELRVLGVDVGARGILRRLSLEDATDRLYHIVGRSLAETLIPWHYVESVPAKGASVRLSVPSSRLEHLHPADISRIINQLPAEGRAAAVEQFSDETIAEAMGELDAPLQVSIMEGMDNERASDILERMAPDEATDLLQDLPPKRQEELLTLMEDEEAADLKELLRYDEHSAGGLMTTEYIALPAHLSAEEAIAFVRDHAPGAETVYYLYIVDEEERLMGVLSLRSLITSPPERPVAESMTTAVVSVPASMDQEDVAAVISKYRLLAVPVVGAENRLLGIVTVDDTIDVVDAEAEEDVSHIAGTPAETPDEPQPGGTVALSRFPWLLLAATAGLFAASFLHRLSEPMLLRAAIFLPLLFLLGNQMAAQAAATTARGIALHEVDRGTWWSYSLAELRVSGLVAAAAALVSGLAAMLTGGSVWALAVGCSAAAVVLSGSLLGLVVPMAEAAVQLDPAVALRPIVVSLMAAITSALYTEFVRLFVR